MLGIIELLSARGLDLNTKIKLVRHQDNRDKRLEVKNLQHQRLLELYQSYQSRPVFNCDFIVVFVGLENSKARFFGVYQVKGWKPAHEVPLPSGLEYICTPADKYYYELERVQGFEDIENRVVIKWGGSTLSWHQWLTDKEVVEILPVGYVTEFPGYLDFVLLYDDLVTIINNPDANREWHRMLAAVAGVYLITDLMDGKQYVGSAYGERGILGRWADYARSAHGGNDQLEKLILADPAYAKNFQFTILRTLPRTLTKNEVIAQEVLYKKKLGSRAYGLNSN